MALYHTQTRRHVIKEHLNYYAYLVSCCMRLVFGWAHCGLIRFLKLCLSMSSGADPGFLERAVHMYKGVCGGRGGGGRYADYISFFLNIP